MTSPEHVAKILKNDLDVKDELRARGETSDPGESIEANGRRASGSNLNI